MSQSKDVCKVTDMNRYNLLLPPITGILRLEPNQCNIEESNKHRIGWLKVDEE